ncbi:ribonuclease H-like domain-containing protein [Tanacetum coccineum]
MVVIWNPAIRKSVGIVVISKPGYKRTIVGFGVCPNTSDPKLVKINVAKLPSMWEVEVFTLSTRFWKTVYIDAPFKSCDLTMFQVFVNGVIYFRAHGFNFVNHVRSNLIISFDLKSEKFGEVCLPERLVHAPELEVMMVNESLGFLEYYFEGEMSVCGVWTRKDSANKSFTKIYTVKVEGKWVFDKVLGFRNNGEVVMEMDDDNYVKSEIKVYEPLSGKINGVGINGNRDKAVTQVLLFLSPAIPFVPHYFPLGLIRYHKTLMSMCLGVVEMGALETWRAEMGPEMDSKTRMAVIWNPTVRKSVGIVVIPKAGYKRPIVGFGVCPDTSDPKLVKINVSKMPSRWEEWRSCMKLSSGVSTRTSVLDVAKVNGVACRVLGFRNNGEVVMQLDDENNHEYRIEVYEPLSGIISGVGINGNQGTFSVRSYMETLLLLDQSDSIIH